MSAERSVAASSNSPLTLTASGAASAHLPQAVQAPASKISTSSRRLRARLGQIAAMRSAICQVSCRGRNAGGVGSEAAELSGRAG
jgi:hypothetical protein